jgi:hypothetical protein
MKTKEEILKVMRYSDEILEIIDNRDEFTRGDLQGCVEGIVNKIIEDTKNSRK